MGDPKYYIRQGSIDDENFLYLARKLGHHLNALNASIENLDTSGTYNDLKKEIEDLKSVVEAIEEYDDTELKNELQSLKDDIAKIEEYDAELRESLSNLQGYINLIDGYINQLNNSVNTINTSISDINTSIQNHYTLYDSKFTSVDEVLENLQQQINILKTEVASMLFVETREMTFYPIQNVEEFTCLQTDEMGVDNLVCFTIEDSEAYACCISNGCLRIITRWEFTHSIDLTVKLYYNFSDGGN